MKKTGDRVRLVAGFLPRGLARLLVQEGEQAAYAQAQALGYLNQQDIQVRIYGSIVLFSRCAFLHTHSVKLGSGYSKFCSIRIRLQVVLRIEVWNMAKNIMRTR